MLQIAVEHALLLCAFMSVVIAGSLRHDPRIWQHDAPKVLQDQLGPISEATRRRRSAWAAVMVVGLVAMFAGLMARVDGDFGDRMLAALITFELFNLYDAVVIDILLLLVWEPAWAYPPGMRGHPALRDPRFHLGNFVKGALGGIPFSALVAGIASLV